MVQTHRAIVNRCRAKQLCWRIGSKQNTSLWLATVTQACCFGLLIGLGNLAPAQAVTRLDSRSKHCSTLRLKPAATTFSGLGCDRPQLSSPKSTTSMPPQTDIDPQPTSLPENLVTPENLVAPEDLVASENPRTPQNTAANNLLPRPRPVLPTLQAQTETPSTDTDLDLDPQIIEDSPVLQRWLEEIPDIAADVKYDPAFRTQLRVGYAQFPSTDQTGGIHLGIQDAFIGQTPLTVSAEYAANFRGDRSLFGIDAQYYLLPLGWYGNVAPVLGYRTIATPDFDSSGLNVGFRIILIPSRGGGAALSLTQTWVAPGTEDEVGITTFSAGYALTSEFRLATDIQTQNAFGDRESRVSILLEWML